MALSEEQKEMVWEWVREKLSRRLRSECPTCGTEAGWELIDELIEAPLRNSNIEVVHMVGLTCLHCSHMLLFSAQAMGLTV